MKYKNFKKGKFNHETLTVTFGGELSNPKNRFTAQAIKVPDYKYKVKERADAGGGWYYGYSELVEYTETNAYIILKDGQVIGWMTPYSPNHNIKSDLYPMDYDYTSIHIKKFAEKITAQQ